MSIEQDVKSARALLKTLNTTLQDIAVSEKGVQVKVTVHTIETIHGTIPEIMMRVFREVRS